MARSGGATSVALVSLLILLALSAFATAQGQGQLIPDCVTKLVPCAAYINSSTTPPSSCCDPLKEAVTQDLPCLCKLLNNKEILEDFKIDPNKAFLVAQRCGLSTANTCYASGPSSSGGTIPPPATAGGNNGSGAESSGLTTIGVFMVLLLWCFVA